MQIGDITQSLVSLTEVIQSLVVSSLRCRTQESTCPPTPPPPPVPALHPAILCVLILAAASGGPGAAASPAATHLRPQVRVTLGVDGVTQLILNLL